MKTGYIYRFWLQDKSYIGQTVDLKKTKSRHKAAKEDTKFYRAIQKHGFDSFQFEILESNIPVDKLDSHETHWIVVFNSFHNGYNSTIGGQKLEGGENHPNYGKPPWNKGKTGIYSKEHRETISKIHKGKTITEKHKKSMAEKMQGSKNPFYNKRHTSKAKGKLSRNRKGRIPWNKGKKQKSSTAQLHLFK